MIGRLRSCLAASTLLAALLGAGTAFAQEPGGILQMPGFASPASMSIHEESTIAAGIPLMGVFNNLVLFDQHVAQNSLASIVPELASDWSWDETGTALTFHLHQGVKWHDGKPFTAADVKCTWDALAGKASDKFRVNPRKSWYGNLDEITTNGDYEVTFHLKRPQPYLIALLASGQSPVYPCHVPLRDMRSHPIGTGPFKFVEYKPNEHIRVVRNPDYWKPGRPYLDGIETTIIPSVSTRLLAFVAGKFDMIQLTVPQLKDAQSQAPEARCDVVMDNNSRDLLINRAKPPFDNPDLRRAMTLTLDRKAFIDIISGGQGEIGGAMQPAPAGLWGMPPALLNTLPGYGPDVEKNRAQARQIIQTLGYGRDNHLKIKVTARDIPYYRDPAVILIDQLKEVYIDGELEPVDTTNFFPKMLRRDYVVGLNLQGAADPDQTFPLGYGCGSEFNRDNYCNPAVDELIEQQSIEADQQKRKQLVWQIERKLAEDSARPIIFYSRGGTCRQPAVKGLTLMVNSIFNGNRREDVWLDK